MLIEVEFEYQHSFFTAKVVVSDDLKLISFISSDFYHSCL